jgi:hypothetical protein
MLKAVETVFVVLLAVGIYGGVPDHSRQQSAELGEGVEAHRR